MNYVGKSLVFVQLGLSLVLLSWGVAVFAYPVDLGWKEPRKVWVDPPEGKKDNERIASELDKRAAAVRLAVDAKHRAVARADKAVQELRGIEHRFWQYHLAYLAELDKLERAPGNIEIREILLQNGTPVLSKDSLGVVLDKPFKDVNQSFAAYDKIRIDREGQIDKLQEEIRKLLEAEQQVTLHVSGKDETGKRLGPGLYGLLEIEAAKQQKLKEEHDYLQPLWIRELNSAQIQLRINGRLKKRLKELGD
jgi:hypothetical protein